MDSKEAQEMILPSDLAPVVETLQRKDSDTPIVGISLNDSAQIQPEIELKGDLT